MARACTREELEARVDVLERILGEKDARISGLEQRMEALVSRAEAFDAPRCTASDEEEQRKALKPRGDVREGVLRDILRVGWGLELVGGVKELVSYDDVNFLCIARAIGSDGAGRKHTLKIHNGVESRNRGILDAQNGIMLHLHQRGVNCPVPQQCSDGSYVHECTLPTKTCETTLAVRLLSWVDGTTLSDFGASRELLVKAGAFLGSLSTALETFDHSATHREHAWDVRQTEGLRAFTHCIAHDAKNDHERRKDIVESVVDAFVLRTTPHCETLPRSVLMGDFNDANIIVDSAGEISGVVDFGDAVHSWRVNDLCIAMAYGMLSSWGKEEGHHVDAALAVLEGFVSVTQLTSEEIRLLRVLPACRLACSYTFGMFSFSQDPTNEYLLLHASPAGRALEVWWAETEESTLTQRIDTIVANAK